MLFISVANCHLASGPSLAWNMWPFHCSVPLTSVPHESLVARLRKLTVVTSRPSTTSAVLMSTRMTLVVRR